MKPAILLAWTGEIVLRVQQRLCFDTDSVAGKEERDNIFRCLIVPEFDVGMKFFVWGEEYFPVDLVAELAIKSQEWGKSLVSGRLWVPNIGTNRSGHDVERYATIYAHSSPPSSSLSTPSLWSFLTSPSAIIFFSLPSLAVLIYRAQVLPDSRRRRGISLFLSIISRVYVCLCIPPCCSFPLLLLLHLHIAFTLGLVSFHSGVP